MQGNDGFHAPSRRVAWLLVTAMLVLMLALAGCAGRGAQHDTGTTGGTSVTQQTTGSGPETQTGSGSSSAAQQVQSLDQQVQGISSSMDSSSQDADTDYSSQDSEVQP